MRPPASESLSNEVHNSNQVIRSSCHINRIIERVVSENVPNRLQSRAVEDKVLHVLITKQALVTHVTKAKVRCRHQRTSRTQGVDGKIMVPHACKNDGTGATEKH